MGVEVCRQWGRNCLKGIPRGGELSTIEPRTSVPPIHLSTQVVTKPSTHPADCQSTYPSTQLTIHPPNLPSPCSASQPPNYPSSQPATYTYPSVLSSFQLLFIHWPTYPSILTHLPVHQSNTHLSIYPQIHPFTHLPKHSFVLPNTQPYIINSSTDLSSHQYSHPSLYSSIHLLPI